jgi:hypothetical protein
MLKNRISRLRLLFGCVINLFVEFYMILTVFFDKINGIDIRVTNYFT